MIPTRSRVDPDRGAARPRARVPIAYVKRVVARFEVRLSSGEMNCRWQITRSVICLNMRERLLSLVVWHVGRAIRQTFEEALRIRQFQSNKNY